MNTRPKKKYSTPSALSMKQKSPQPKTQPNWTAGSHWIEDDGQHRKEPSVLWICLVHYPKTRYGNLINGRYENHHWGVDLTIFERLWGAKDQSIMVIDCTAETKAVTPVFPSGRGLEGIPCQTTNLRVMWLRAKTFNNIWAPPDDLSSWPRLLLG